MRRSTLSCVVFLTILAVLSPFSVEAKPKKKTYNNSPEQVFIAAMRTARERHVVTYVNEKMLMFTFETGRSFASEGFVANAAVEPEGTDKSTLIINVQNKRGMSWGAGDRMAEKFYDQVSDELAGDSKQASAVKSTEKAIAVPDAKAAPETPSITKSADAAPAPAPKDEGKITLNSVPDGAEVYVDDNFVGNTPAALKLPSGKHKVKVSDKGYADWEKEISVFAGSDVNMKATLEKN
ncbi:MAG: PEGA domain-containing protein [Acidobacteria bacterium]|nr:PEGA domain-containing protein [Acidobacteriota bacterium]